MKTKAELHRLLSCQSFCKVNAHIHTHLCDGAKDMTVENIANQADACGMSCIILTPHFHKQVHDETTTLYTDTHEDILIQLRAEIEEYYKNHHTTLTILLSTEADILDIHGNTSLVLSPAGEAALDMVTPTINYHPLLPLKAVEVTYGRCIEQIHSTGLYKQYADKAGGIEKVLKTLYEAEANAILNSPYPCMLGHFFAAHSYAKDSFSWFGAQAHHMEIMKEGAQKVIDACQKSGAAVDLTGIHHIGETIEEKQLHDGFFFDFQTWFLRLCREKNVIALPGTDSHGLGSIGHIDYYKSLHTQTFSVD